MSCCMYMYENVCMCTVHVHCRVRYLYRKIKNIRVESSCLLLPDYRPDCTDEGSVVQLLYPQFSFSLATGSYCTFGSVDLHVPVPGTRYLICCCLNEISHFFLPPSRYTQSVYLSGHPNTTTKFKHVALKISGKGLDVSLLSLYKKYKSTNKNSQFQNYLSPPQKAKNIFFQSKFSRFFQIKFVE